MVIIKDRIEPIICHVSTKTINSIFRLGRGIVMLNTRKDGLRTVFSKQAYLNIIYLLLDLPVSVIYFMLLSTVLVFSLGTMVCWIGIPIFFIMIKLLKGMIVFERKMITKLLNIKIHSSTFETIEGANILDKVKKNISNLNMWKYVVYFFVKLPITMVTFTICISSIVLPLGLFMTPFLYKIVTYTIGPFQISTMNQALFASVFGITLGLCYTPLINWIAYTQAGRFVNLVSSLAHK